MQLHDIQIKVSCNSQKFQNIASKTMQYRRSSENLHKSQIFKTFYNNKATKLAVDMLSGISI